MIGRALIERRSTLKQPDQLLVDALTGGTTYAGPTVSSQTALGHVDVFACVRVLAQSAGSLPLIVYRHTAGGRERADDARIARVLAAPMPGVTQGGLVASAMAHLQLWGNAYVAKYRDASGQVSQLGLLDPSQMTVQVHGGEPIYRYARIEGDLTRRDILHIKGFSVDGVYGVSPIGQARQTLGLGLALEEHAARFFSNGAHPSGVIQMPSSPTPEQVKLFRESWDAMHGGTSRAHRPAILTGGASWQPIGMPPEDAQFVEQRKLSTTQVCRVFGVYPWMIFGDSGDSLTYANVEQQQIAFVTHSLRPWLVTIEQALASDDDLFGTTATGLYPEFLIDALLRGDAATRAAVYQAATGGKPWMTRNEVRRAENLPAIDGGDQLDPPDTTPDPPSPAPSAAAARELGEREERMAGDETWATRVAAAVVRASGAVDLERMQVAERMVAAAERAATGAASAAEAAQTAAETRAEVVVNVPETIVQVDAPVVNVTTPAPVVNVTTPAPVVNVQVEQPQSTSKSSIQFKRDPAGRITGAEMTEEE